MPDVNQDILSEIRHAPGISDGMKNFLEWLIDFERKNAELDKGKGPFKKEIEAATEQFIDN